MPRDASSEPRHRDLLVLIAATLIVVATQAWQLAGLVPLLPSATAPSRSPSSDVLLGALPLPDAADRLDALTRTLPAGPGVVVAHAPTDAVASAYMVITMRLWPRPVSLVTCAPTPRVEQFRWPHPVPTPSWRVDLFPGAPTPLTWRPTATSSPEALCAEDVRP